MDRKDLTKAQRWEIANRLVIDRMGIVNQLHEEAHPRMNTFYSKYGKRILDILISGLVLIIVFPINLFIGIITFFDVGYPIFFRQERVGKNGKLFYIIKFRNMKNVYDERGELLPAKQRVTKFGSLMRKTSLDELLNFWSILKGDMSIIGPRPLVPEYYHRWSKRHLTRLSVRPGLECPPRKLDGHVWTWQEQFENDVWYVENISFKTDLKMLYNLFCFAVDRTSVSVRANATRGKFMGYEMDGTAINLDGIPQEYVEWAAREVSIDKEAYLDRSVFKK